MASASVLSERSCRFPKKNALRWSVAKARGGINPQGGRGWFNKNLHGFEKKPARNRIQLLDPRNLQRRKTHGPRTPFNLTYRISLAPHLGVCWKGPNFIFDGLEYSHLLEKPNFTWQKNPQKQGNFIFQGPIFRAKLLVHVGCSQGKHEKTLQKSTSFKLQFGPLVIHGVITPINGRK